MEAKEVVEKSKALQKATAAGEAPANIIRILNELKVGVKASEDLLRSTKIGVIVNRSKQSKDPGVAHTASEIVKKWRDDIQKSKRAGTPAHNGSPTAANDKSHLNGSKAPTSNGDKPGVPPDQRDFKKDGVKIDVTNQETRDRCIGLFYNGLCFQSTAAPSAVLEVAIAVEKAAFNAFGPESNATYASKNRSLFMNLKNKSNPGLRHGVMSGEIAPDRFVNMSNDELKSAERRKEDLKIVQENLKDSQVPQAEKSISSSLQCGKCGEKKVSYSQAQTRSADEPMTTFCECTVCGKRWKVSNPMAFISTDAQLFVVRMSALVSSRCSVVATRQGALSITILILPSTSPFQNHWGSNRVADLTPSSLRLGCAKARCHRQ